MILIKYKKRHTQAVLKKKKTKKNIYIFYKIQKVIFVILKV